jgi:glycosyltransferase involved in cell wall biosynthesis
MVIAALARLYTKRSKKFISVSAEVAKILRRYSENETAVIPNGVDVDRFHPEEKDGNGSKERNGEKKICIGYLGRLSREKNIINMIKAVKMLDNDSISLKIAGAGPLYNTIKLMEDERIRVLGYVEDAPSFYHSIDVFLLPSKLEAQPIVLLEAMASGLPIIATDVGDNKYFINGNGILCGTSAKEIREAIAEILKEDLQKMGSLSRIKVEREYTWERIAEKTLQVYKSQ